MIKRIIITALVMIGLIFIYLRIPTDHINNADKLIKKGDLTAAALEINKIQPNDKRYQEAKMYTQIISALQSEQIKKKEEIVRNRIEKQKQDSIDLIRSTLVQIKNSEFIIDNFHILNYQQNIKGINAILNEFEKYESFVIKHKESNVDSIRINIELLAKKISDKRFQIWPELRKTFGDFLAKEMWVYDMYVYTKSHRNTVIEFVSAEYYTNANIKKTQEDLTPYFKKLRFRKIIYKGSKYDEDFQYYNFSPKSDNEFS